MEQHWSIEAKSPTRSKHLAILSEVGLEKRNFGNGICNFKLEETDYVV